MAMTPGAGAADALRSPNGGAGQIAVQPLRDIAVGATSEVATDIDCSGPAISDPDLAFVDPAYSHGTFRVAAGHHVLWIRTSESPFTTGGAYFRVDAATPSP